MGRMLRTGTSPPPQKIKDKTEQTEQDTHRSSTEDKNRDFYELDEEREQKQAEQRTHLKEMEDELQQTKDQKMRLEVNMQT